MLSAIIIALSILIVSLCVHIIAEPGTPVELFRYKYIKRSNATGKIVETVKVDAVENVLEKPLRDLISLIIKVEDLKMKINADGFRPDLIIGISRGGACMAAALSRSLGGTPTPVVTLWPLKRNEKYYNNELNSLSGLQEFFKGARLTLYNVLIVDDMVVHGNHLQQAKLYVKQELPTAEVRIAAIKVLDIQIKAKLNYVIEKTTINPE